MLRRKGIATITRTELIGRDSGLSDLINHARDVAERCAAGADAADAAGGFPAGAHQWLHEAELLQAPLRREFGGVGLGLEAGTWRTTLQVLKQIGWGSLAVGRVYEGHVNALQLVQKYGSPEQIEAYAADAREGRMFGVWNAEDSHGVKIEPLGDGHYRLHGAKIFCSGVGAVTRPFVNGTLPDGSGQMCIVPMELVSEERIDVDWWQPLGMRASASYRVDFTGIVVDQHALIGESGQYTLQPWFSGGAIRFAAVQLGGAEALFDATRAYVRDARRTDDPYQRQRAAEMAIAIESGILWLDGAARIAERGDDHPEAFVSYANMMRSAIEHICMDVLTHAERTVGARGLMRPQPMERMMRDLRMYLRQPTPDAALADVGRYVLEHAQRAGDVWKQEREESRGQGS